MATSKELLRAIKSGATVQNQHGEPVEYRPSKPGDRKPWKLVGRDLLGWGAGDCVAIMPVEAEEAPVRTIPGVGVLVPSADPVAAEEPVTEEAKPVEGTFHTYLKITPEVIRALRTLREFARNSPYKGVEALAIDVLDNAGIFAPIDETTGYDIDPEPERISKCTCPGWKPNGLGEVETHRQGCPGDPAERISKCTCHPAPDARSSHHYGCPGDPAEYGDTAYVSKVPGWSDAVDALRKMYEARETPRTARERRPCPADQCTLSFAVNKDGTLHQHLNDMLRPCPGVAPIEKEN